MHHQIQAKAMFLIAGKGAIQDVVPGIKYRAHPSIADKLDKGGLVKQTQDKRGIVKVKLAQARARGLENQILIHGAWADYNRLGP